MYRIPALLLLTCISFVLSAQTKERLIASYSSQFNSGTSTFNFRDSETYSYTGGNGGSLNEDNYAAQFVGKYTTNNSWALGSSGYYNIYKAHSYFDANDNITANTSMLLSATTHTWTNFRNYLYTYDALNNQTSAIYQIGNTTGSPYWQNHDEEKSLYVGHNLISDTTLLWNSITANWDLHWLTTYAYDTRGNMTNETDFIWSGVHSTWLPQIRRQYYVNSANYDDSIIVSNFDTITNNWINPFKGIYTYDASNKVIADTNKNWDKTLGQWVNASMQANAYSGIDLVSAIYSVWNGGSWTNGSEYTYTYNAMHNKTTQVTANWDSISSSFVNWDKDSSAYDAAGYMIFTTNYSWNGAYWSYLGGNLLNRYYYETYTPTSIKGINNSNLICKLYPNPARDFMNIDLQLTESGAAIIGVYDMSGKLYRQWQTESTVQYFHQLNVSSLPAGNYILKIQNKNNRLAQQFSVVH